MAGKTAALDRMQRSELHYAAAKKGVEDVRRLIAAGADVCLADGNGWTPLHFAAQSLASGVAELLLASGAEVDARDSYGNTPLSKAVFNSRGDGACIAVLRAAGADPNSENNYGASPVKLARTISNFDVARHFADLPVIPWAG